MGSPQDALEIVGGGARTPVTLANTSTNAIAADALAQTGRTREAQQLLDAILKLEADHVYALRARINLEIRTGKAMAAISDAQRLVSVLSKSARIVFCLRVHMLLPVIAGSSTGHFGMPSTRFRPIGTSTRRCEHMLRNSTARTLSATSMRSIASSRTRNWSKNSSDVAC